LTEPKWHGACFGEIVLNSLAKLSIGLQGFSGSYRKGTHRGTFMSDAYVIEISGFTAGIVTRDTEDSGFNFFSAAPRFNLMEGRHFADPLAAERAARQLAEHGGLPRRAEASKLHPVRSLLSHQ
jgi:hypothetical protein